jgi:hypothetical protein
MWIRQTSLLKTKIMVILTFCGSFFFNGCTNHPEKPANEAYNTKTNVGGWTITTNSVSPAEFRSALHQNINAPFVTAITDSVHLEKALMAIDKTYTDTEKELAKQELCKTTRCLTTFKAFYPDLDLLLFNIADNHCVKAAFVTASTNEMASSDERYNGDYGVLSKNGYWVGLKRQDSDNYMKLELCRLVDGRFWSQFSVDYTTIDINEKEKLPIFWADNNTIYVAAEEHSSIMPTDITVYYVIKFINEEPKF